VLKKMSRIEYLSRIVSAYVMKKNSQLSFWHDIPAVNEAAFCSEGDPKPYYMGFHEKADFAGEVDPESGVPLLDYHGKIGKQKNPVAIAQYGLGNMNLYFQTREESRLRKALGASDWLVRNLKPNPKGVEVWLHEFDFEYTQVLRNPWYSGLAQGQGISLLLRAALATGQSKYREAAERAYLSLTVPLEDGGCLSLDSQGNLWIEEYITDPPTHILNGFIWALWGLHDYVLWKQETSASQLLDEMLATLVQNLARYDCGYWSLYDLSGLRMENLASPFYHELHIVQLDIMKRLTGNRLFGDYSERWKQYRNSRPNRYRALAKKAAFKLAYF
jgi:heparosan-N-sulfate-glucuronate 5-epimerase